MSRSSRARVRVGRVVRFFPTTTQATALGGAVGVPLTAVITAVNADGTVNLKVDAAAAVATDAVDTTYGAQEAAVIGSLRDKAGIIANVRQGDTPGTYSLLGA